MTFARLLATGFAAARRHPRLILATYLVSLVPALALVFMARATVTPVLDHSLFSAQVLDGAWIGVGRDFTASPESDLGVILGAGLTLAILLTALVQVPLAAGTVEVLLEREGAQHPFFTGIAKNSGRFFRSLLWFLPTGIIAVSAGALTAAGFFKLAAAKLDARYDLAGLAAAALVALLLLSISHPAYSLTRIAAAHHNGDRKTLRGYLRAIRQVARRPTIFLPLCAAYILMVVVLHLAYTAARSPFTAATSLGILAVLLAQQAVMLVRAFLQVSMWGAELAAYRLLGAPHLCDKKGKRRTVLVVDEPPVGREVPAPPAPQVEPAPPPAVVDDVFSPTSGPMS